MGDLSLDMNGTSQLFGDLILVDGDLVINAGADAVRQSVMQRLKTYLGEWYLDNRVGVPYYQEILVKNPDLGKIDAIFQNAILDTPGILSLDKYRAVLNRVERRYEVAFKATSTDGPIDYTGFLNA